MLNRVSQRGDSFVLDNSPSYPRWVDGSPRGPPRLSTIDVNFARNSVITRFHQSLPENAPSTPHAPLPAFLTSQQASNSSKKSDSELTTSLKLLHQSSDERLEFYGIDGKIQEESGTLFSFPQTHKQSRLFNAYFLTRTEKCDIFLRFNAFKSCEGRPKSIPKACALTCSHCHGAT